MAEILTKEQVQEKADSLSKELNKKVYPIMFNVSETDQVVGYVKEPSRQAKIVAIGAINAVAGDMNIVDLGMPLLESGLIREQSDPRLYSDNSEDDGIVISAAMTCGKILKVHTNEFDAGIKKN